MLFSSRPLQPGIILQQAADCCGIPRGSHQQRYSGRASRKIKIKTKSSGWHVSIGLRHYIFYSESPPPLFAAGRGVPEACPGRAVPCLPEPCSQPSSDLPALSRNAARKNPVQFLLLLLLLPSSTMLPPYSLTPPHLSPVSCSLHWNCCLAPAGHPSLLSPIEQFSS